DVEWAFHEQGGQTLVRIRHDLTLHWPLVGDWIADQVIGPQFVERIARKTLLCIRDLAEHAA
ncbi:MAG TPA: hypothetical protein VH916_12605, partial [Dehalococcoidia bacterium]